MTLAQAIKIAIERNDIATRVEVSFPSAMTYQQLRDQLLTRRHSLWTSRSNEVSRTEVAVNPPKENTNENSKNHHAR
jgi:hypothetical protein